MGESLAFCCLGIFDSLIGDLFVFECREASCSSLIPGTLLSFATFIDEITSVYLFTFISFNFAFPIYIPIQNILSSLASYLVSLASG